MKQARIPSVYASPSFIPPTKSPKGDAILRRGCGVVIGQIPGPAAGHARGRSGDTGSYHAGHTHERRGGWFHRLQALAEVQARAQRLSRPGCQQHGRHHEDA